VFDIANLLECHEPRLSILRLCHLQVAGFPVPGSAIDYWILNVEYFHWNKNVPKLLQRQ